ncbi:MAG: hypothetical protein D6730_11640 [Bacteroidetes bacterium]|nr:MAG: hypothetical protein D6730_11640 [Bacteroidota bacterium]
MLKNSFNLSITLLLLLGGLWSCEEVTDCLNGNYQNLEVVENTYTGRIEVTSRESDPGGDFYGNGDSGTYSFAWVNSHPTADVNFDITTPTGSVQMIIKDCQGVEVLNQTRSAGGNDTFSGVTRRGSAGTWLVSLIFTDFDGDGSYSLSPGD